VTTKGHRKQNEIGTSLYIPKEDKLTSSIERVQSHRKEPIVTIKEFLIIKNEYEPEPTKRR
jgi:hypothetical protein